MQQRRYFLVSTFLILVTAMGAAAITPASAQTTSGQFNPQTQFPVGTKLQITSIYGLETAPPPTSFSGARFNYGNASWRNGDQNGGNRVSSGNQEWNLTYLRAIPTANSSIALNAQVTNDTQDGGILWIVQGGTITYNETTLTVTTGIGGIGKLDRTIMVGNATDSAGNSYRWSLQGLVTLYGGGVILSLAGSIIQANQNLTTGSITPPSRNFTQVRGISLTYIATIS